MNNFDVVVIGSGTGGQTAAYDLRKKGLTVAIVEESDRPGGTCALYGCQPKKWFYEATETVARSRHLKGKGLVDAPIGEWSAIQTRKNRFTSQVPKWTRDGLKDEGIELIPGTARFLDSHTMAVEGKPIHARHYVLATGARPMSLPIRGVEHVISSDAFLELNDLPDRILFIGGGFISFEFAHFAARLGGEKSRVTILEIADRPLGPFDSDMVDLLVEASMEENITVQTRTAVSSIERVAGGFTVKTRSGEAFEADLVVHGAGRVPDIENLDLEAADIRFSLKGISVDDVMKTSNPKVFAIGDCAATPQLARVADYEAHVAAGDILAKHGVGRSTPIDYSAVPALLFTYPQYGMVGSTEAALEEGGIDYRKSFEKNLGWPTYTRIGLTHAAYKILVGPDNAILGAHILSDNASGLINTLKQAMINDIRADRLYRQNIMSPYPSRESDLIYMLEPFLDQD